jgi:hypothetical protein
MPVQCALIRRSWFYKFVRFCYTYKYRSGQGQVAGTIPNPASLSPCHPSLLCWILFWQHAKPDCCILLVYFEPFMLSSDYWMNKNIKKHFQWITNLTHNSFYICLFISILYMFWATLCSSSGESIVSIQHLVYVTLCRWPSGMQVWTQAAYRLTHASGRTKQDWLVPDAACTVFEFLMMSGKTAQNM